MPRPLGLIGTEMIDNRQHADAAQIDVANILEGLRAEVRARRLAQGQAEEGPLERDLRRSLDEIELHRVISAHWPLLGKSVPQRVVALGNKLVRRYLRWYINPIVEQQNRCNAAFLALDALREARERELWREVAELRERIATLERRSAALDPMP